MKKPGCGLTDASKCWYDTLAGELIMLRCEKLPTDHAVFFYWKRGTLSGIISCHVDDLQITADDDFDEDILNPIFNLFKFGTIEEILIMNMME